MKSHYFVIRLSFLLYLLCLLSLKNLPAFYTQHFDAVNAVIGDVSYIDAFESVPNEDADRITRLQTHLFYVEKLLRARDTSHLTPEQKANRIMNLDRLHEYTLAAEFPVNYKYAGRRPCFIDKHDNFCAVGYLVKVSGYEKEARMIAALDNYGYVEFMEFPALDAWVAQSGLSKIECAMIQPSYGGGTPYYRTESVKVSETEGNTSVDLTLTSNTFEHELFSGTEVIWGDHHFDIFMYVQEPPHMWYWGGSDIVQTYSADLGVLEAGCYTYNLTVHYNTQDPHFAPVVSTFSGDFCTTETVDGFTFRFRNGEGTIIDCDDSVGNPLIIPEKINGKPVTRIGPEAFSGITNLVEIQFPSRLTHIDDRAFDAQSDFCMYFFKSLTAPTLGENVFADGLANGFTYFPYRGSGYTDSQYMMLYNFTPTHYRLGSPEADDWLIDNFPDATPKADSDDDGDGRPLVVEYALGSDPVASSDESLPVSLVDDLGTDYVTLTYRKLKPDVTYTVEQSSNLKDWSTDGVVELVPGDINNDTIAGVPVGTGKFLRLKVSTL